MNNNLVPNLKMLELKLKLIKKQLLLCQQLLAKSVETPVDKGQTDENGIISFSSRYIYKGRRKGGFIMRDRVNHKELFKGKFDKKFWKEFKERGFKIDPNNGGHLVKSSSFSNIKKVRTGVYSYAYKGQRPYKFNIIPGAALMKTVMQIEGIVKYKLFK